MFDSLSEKLQRSFKTLRGQGTISDENVADALREIRLALLEADVNLSVVDTLIDHIRTKSLGSQVTTALSPSPKRSPALSRPSSSTILGRDISKFKDCLPAPFRGPHGRAPGLRQDDHIRQARPMAEKGRPPPHARLGRRLPPRSPRAARPRRQIHRESTSTRASSTPPQPEWHTQKSSA